MDDNNGKMKKMRTPFSIWASEILLFLFSLTVFLLAFSRGLTWCLAVISGKFTSEGYWQSIWDGIIEKLGVAEDDFIIVVYTNIMMATLFWTMGFAFIAIDVFKWPKWAQNYKVQPGTNEIIDRKRLSSVIMRGIFNQIFVTFPLSLILYFTKCHSPIVILPTFSRALIDFVVFFLVEEIGFYYTHRLLHHPSLYKRIHKKHHEWTAPIAIAATYCHPFEHLLSNLLPLALGPVIMSSHILVTWAWYILATVNTLTVHSGYHFPWMLSPESHDFHHRQFTECFGTMGILDYLHGTDKIFRASGYERRNFVSLSLEPVSSRFPVTQHSSEKAYYNKSS